MAKKKSTTFDSALLKKLCEIQSASGHEKALKDFLLHYINKEKKKWKNNVEIIEGEHLQDCFLLKFGKPRTAIFAHMDSIGFSVRYSNQLVSIGSPDAETGTLLVGKDSLGEIECSLELDHEHHAFYKFGRPIERGTPLTYKIDFRESNNFVETPYLDNRLGIYNALKVAETLKDGVIAFSCWEEHGGGSVGYLAELMYKKWKIRQALISDITWVTDGVHPGFGPAISLRDSRIPRKKFLSQIQDLASSSGIPFQLEVEGTGGSDGKELQTSPYGWDWAFIGVPQYHSHTPQEYVAIADVKAAVKLYAFLLQNL